MELVKSASLEINVWGSADNPPLVFLHGFLGGGIDWAGICEKFQENYYCVAPNLPGAIEVDRLRRDIFKPLSIPLVAREVAEALNPIVQETFSLVSYSMGGRIALSALAQNLIRPKAAVFISTNPGIVVESEREARIESDQLLAKRVLAESCRSFLDRWYSSSVFSSLQQSEVLRAELVERRAETNDPVWVAKVLEELSPGVMPNYWESICQISCPQLWLAGELDPKYVQLCSRVKKQVPGVEVLSVPGAGHALHLEQEELFVDRLREFL